MPLPAKYQKAGYSGIVVVPREQRPTEKTTFRLGTDIEIIRASLRNILNTTPGERPESAFGSNLRRLLFEPDSPFLREQIQEEISNIIRWEPRIYIISIRYSFQPRTASVQVRYGLRDNPAITDTLEEDWTVAA